MRQLLAAAVLTAAVAIAAPAAAVVPPGNLLVNPGAEAGAGATDSSTSLPLPGWTVTNGFTAVQYGTPAFLTTADAAALGGGVNFFSGGPDSDSSTATQTLNVSAAGPEIDAGKVTATLSGLLGGFADQEDAVSVTAQFLSAASAPLGTALQIGPVTATDRAQTTTLLPRSASAAVPAGTRAIVVQIVSVRASGTFNDGYADNLGLLLSEGGVPAFHKTVVVQVVKGTVLVKPPGSSKFVALSGSEGIPLGSTVDTRHGTVALTSVPKAGGAPESANFFDGLFKVTQPGAITQLALSEPLTGCAKAGKAGAAAKKPKTRRLWGDGAGSFRTKGTYSAATVRGTKWLVQDSCTSTLTRVTQGVVSVLDTVRHKTILVKAGKHYTARAKRR